MTGIASVPSLPLKRAGFTVIGQTVSVGVEHDEVLVPIRRMLRGFDSGKVDADHQGTRYDLISSPAGWQLHVDGVFVHVSEELPGALAALEWRIVSDAVDRRDDLFHLHGAALCLPTRSAGVLLIGDSGDGKTTLALGLMLRGLVPFGDDVVMLEPEALTIQAVHRAFHVRNETWHVLESLAGGPITVDPNTPTGYFTPPQWAHQPVPVRFVVFPKYRPTHVPTLTALTPAAAAAAILPHTGTFARNPAMALSTITRLTERARCFQLQTGDLVDSVGTVLRAFATPID